MSTPTTPLPAGPAVAATTLRDLADTPAPVRHAISAELLYALRILPRPTADDHDALPAA